VVTVPRSMDHQPPGVRGWFCGKARTRMAWHGPGVQVVFVTSSGTLCGGPIGDQNAAKTGSSSAPQVARWEPYLRKALGRRGDISQLAPLKGQAKRRS
jgi:hypothetical protein